MPGKLLKAGNFSTSAVKILLGLYSLIERIEQ